MIDEVEASLGSTQVMHTIIKVVSSKKQKLTKNPTSVAQ